MSTTRVRHQSAAARRTTKPTTRQHLIVAALAIATAFVMQIAAAAAATGPKVTTFDLKNGMQVVVIEDHRAPVVTHMAWYRVGGADELPGKSGIAHFLEHLMFKGTKTVAPGEFSKTVARNGGQDNAFTSLDYTAYFQRVAKDRLPLVMEMEADRMTNLVLTDKEVLPERDVVLEERRSRTENNPQARLSEQMNAAYYLAHPYGQPVIGWPNEIKALNRADALEFYERFYTPNNAILIVAGDVTPDEVRVLAEKFYEPIKRRVDVGPRVRPQEPKHEAAIQVVLKDPRATSPVLQRSYLTPSYATDEPGEAEALDVLSDILGGGTTSRLYEALVVEQKIAAAVGSYFYGDALDSGRFGIYGVAANGDTTDLIENGIEDVVAKLLKDGVTDDEVKRARNRLVAEAIYAQDSQSHMARIYGVALTTGQTVEDVQAWPERISKVTREQVEAVARKYLLIEQSVTGILLPKRVPVTRAKDGKAETDNKS